MLLKSAKWLKYYLVGLGQNLEGLKFLTLIGFFNFSKYSVGW